ncbi:MAG: ion transporter, partial [Planctomycetota bacterium]
MEEIQKSWKEHWYEVIFEADTPAGKAFDVVLLVMIAMSVVTVMLESVPEYRETHGVQLQRAEWFFTIAFTLEYIARIACAPRRGAYVRSFFGMVDLLAILPTYFMVLYPGAQSLAVLRALRLLRVFRVLKLAHMLREASALRRALWQSRSKIAVFLSFVVIVSAIIGSSMYVIEGEEAG